MIMNILAHNLCMICRARDEADTPLTAVSSEAATFTAIIDTAYPSDGVDAPFSNSIMITIIDFEHLMVLLIDANCNQEIL